uniref:glutamate synthase (ferredoxin) n=1 Tax=Cyanidiococcus yangmingshanensis TaxID=2690220 RepID=A0A7G5VUY1_9RHOD|nr:glutamate synthase [Cyanidiococcus yangmingshanensis]QMX77498.1 glutamate synthase [Cyanidiococcus yangmingshanensis]UNJ15904.1 ferredoxin-dependent glutamate synthase [Cyanidioschyzonaceae sp. 3]WDB00407.1 glutamate synthase [Cyanidiococcus yangmingshanensis]
MHLPASLTSRLTQFAGQPWLSKDRDACGVGFICHLKPEPTHSVIERALEALTLMEHRGACGADGESGDGAGLLTQIPWRMLRNEIPTLPTQQLLGLGMMFLPPYAYEEAKQLVTNVIVSNQYEVVCWRKVPYVEEVLGPMAARYLPQIEQVIMTCGDEWQLYLLRKQIEHTISVSSVTWASDFSICSMSSKNVVYKGMMKAAVLSQFYQDFHHPDFETTFAIFHRRFSTNTMPKWSLAQPMRMLAHNGEINTLLGNLKWMQAQEIKAKISVTNPALSDSANLDAAAELVTHFGKHSCAEALMKLIPEALGSQTSAADFYAYYEAIQEAWDGPALIVFSDGDYVGATLDRNGLRPARYWITEDNYFVLASEVIPYTKYRMLSRLAPGEMIAVDVHHGQIQYNHSLKNAIASKHAYHQLIQQGVLHMASPIWRNERDYSSVQLLQWQTCFGYTSEDVELVIEHMASESKEPTFCMGDDIPLAVLSGKPHVLYDYFKQRFAQVTNPAIDALRENLVMSLNIYLGKKTPVWETKAYRVLKLSSPIINEDQLNKIQQLFHTCVLSTCFDKTLSLKQAIEKLCAQAANAKEAEVLLLTDRDFKPDQIYIPPLLAVGAVHQYLIRLARRTDVSLIVDTAQCWSTHHFACLLGYGAEAICPYLALETVRHWWHEPATSTLMSSGKLAACSLHEAQMNYIKAVQSGLLKILSKMGISCMNSYCGAQIFEIIGLHAEVVNLAFEGSVSRIGGMTLEELQMEVEQLSGGLVGKKLPNVGFVQYRPGGEYHVNNPQMAKALHKAVRQFDSHAYEAFKNLMLNRPATTLRDLLRIQSDRASISLSEVEPIEAITKRFCTGGMSLGALSRETHETLAIAMNRIGGKSNSGEGGEDALRFKPLIDVDETGHSPTFPHLKGLKNGDSLSSAIKQVASGRFGVTPEYLVNAKQLEIKIAQGAKPGEGGQLPGKKVSGYIAKLRGCKPGVPLISPPPHHDIYSIEDLAQLIFDLHQINPKAQVSVKLVAEAGIGTIAAGVAKAKADIIQISGHDGGTGASPLSSIKHAGVAWELGLHEVHQTLLENQLRDQVLLRVDGGLRTGHDVIMAALLGAEEFGFGTVAMIASGCIMARICHTNSCPVGVATQKEELRARYPGVPEAVVNYFRFVAEEIRFELAQLGYRSLDELIGRSDLLIQHTTSSPKTSHLHLNWLCQKPGRWLRHEGVHQNPKGLDHDLLEMAKDAIAQHAQMTTHVSMTNTDRSVGAYLSGYIASRYGNDGFQGQLQFNFYGVAGQSFGSFLMKGINFRLVGEANDYVGKGMNGGEIIIVPSAGAQVVLGNTCLYGATGGYLFALGAAGERFAVRNSQAIAVVEGVGDHGCEYMTGGIVVVLGKCGRNFAAGMTGGLAYVLDDNLEQQINPEIVKIQRIVTDEGRDQLKHLLSLHSYKTASPKAQYLLDHWNESWSQFWQVVPPSESNLPQTNPEIMIKLK